MWNTCIGYYKMAARLCCIYIYSLWAYSTRAVTCVLMLTVYPSLSCHTERNHGRAEIYVNASIINISIMERRLGTDSNLNHGLWATSGPLHHVFCFFSPLLSWIIKKLKLLAMYKIHMLGWGKRYMKINFLFSESDRKSINLDILFHAGRATRSSRENGYSCSHWKGHIL